jgi:hypothetical protein
MHRTNVRRETVCTLSLLIFIGPIAQGRSWPVQPPLQSLRGSFLPVAPLPMVTAALGCVPSLRAAARRPRICVSFAPVFSRDSR